MAELSTLSAKHQVTLPKHVREDIKAKAGDKIAFVKTDDKWVILKIPSNPVEALRHLGRKAGLKGTPKEIHEEMESWEE
ncbi:MAG: AbrB/MazE/SpoVT family DNA-binding domain-containing protein [Methanocellales archaeon]|nr:AbrB/MazE/SpoVT family DNA-binding domain-containing protein [Methanocellales archaeon]